MRYFGVSGASLLLIAGCHSPKPAAPGANHFLVKAPMEAAYTNAQTADASQGALAPSELVAMHQQAGVGLGLQVTGRSFRVGQDVPLLLSYRDISAPVRISSTDCSGFSIVLEDVDRGKATVASLSPCLLQQAFAENNVPLVEGNLRFLHTSLADGRLVITRPGRYLIGASWQSFHPHVGPFRKGDDYATVSSNAIPIVVTE